MKGQPSNLIYMEKMITKSLFLLIKLRIIETLNRYSPTALTRKTANGSGGSLL